MVRNISKKVINFRFFFKHKTFIINYLCKKVNATYIKNVNKKRNKRISNNKLKILK
jgi:hypothetical protein